jgi:hypothetical protein
VTVVNGDKVPMVPGFGQQPRFIVTIQPAGAVFNPPAPITLPNVDGLAPRTVTEMYSYDHDIASFVAIGTGIVSDDGQLIRSAPGVGVLKAGWHCGGNPTQSGTAADCGDCRQCINNTCVIDDTRVPTIPPAPCVRFACSDGFAVKVLDTSRTPPQEDPNDCFREVCIPSRPGHFTSVPDDSETPLGPAQPCFRLECSAGKAEAVLDSSNTPPQNSPNDCLKETCIPDPFGAGLRVGSVPDDSEVPIAVFVGCSYDVCKDGAPERVPDTSIPPPQLSPHDCVEQVCDLVNPGLVISTPDNNEIPDPEVTGCFRFKCQDGSIVGAPDITLTPTQIDPHDCRMEICDLANPGLVISVPDDSEVPIQGTVGCNKLVCKDGFAEQVPDTSVPPPQFSPHDCKHEVCDLATPGLVISIPDDSETPLGPAPICRQLTCSGGTPTAIDDPAQEGQPCVDGAIVGTCHLGACVP